jgi:hypothetical protein
MSKPKLKPVYSLALMFTGILIGLVILFTKPDKAIEPIPQTLREWMPAMSADKGSSLSDLFLVLKAGKRIEVLMQKDSLTKQDSLEIKAIDQQLNQLLHD